MTCRQALPAPGSMGAHDGLMNAFVSWRLRQQACEAMPMCRDEAALADQAWVTLIEHAVNCGYNRAQHAEMIPWASRRICAWGQSIGVDQALIAAALGSHLGGGS